MKNFNLSKIVLVSSLCIAILVSCSEDEGNEPIRPESQINNPSLPSTVASQVVNMIFTAAQPTAPYTLNQEVRVTFSSSGMFFLDNNPSANDGDEINIANFTVEGSEYIWKDDTNDYSYALSLKTDSSINELNVSQTSTSSFLGSFVPDVGPDASLIQRFTGTYTVTQTVAGTHSRNTVIIDSNGNIDFDTNTQINTSEFARVEDKLDCCNAITIDTDPYPTQPYGRIILYTDSTQSTLTSIDYRPDHPGFTNRVEVSF